MNDNPFDKIARTTKPKAKRKTRKPKQKHNIHDTLLAHLDRKDSEWCDEEYDSGKDW